MNRIGIAFGGGGARGIAHIGILKALQHRTGLLPSYVAGTSAGSIIGALFAAGVPQEKIEADAHDFEWFKNVVSFPDTLRHLLDGKPAGIVSNRGLEATVNELIDHRTFADLSRELAIVTTDIEKQRRVIFTSPRMENSIDTEWLEAFLPPPIDDKAGCETVVISDFDNIGLVVAASCAIPGIFKPVRIRDMLLVDGGIVDQVPVDVVKSMGADPVVGVSLSFAFLSTKSGSTGALFSSVVEILGVQQLRRSLDLADIGFQIPGIEDRSIFDIHQYDLIEKGEVAMRARLDDLVRLHRRAQRIADTSPT